MNEESPLPRGRFNALTFSLTALRIWQWSSSFFVYVSFGLLHNHIARNRLGENHCMRSVQALGLVSLLYSSIVIVAVHVFKSIGRRTWCLVFAIMSVSWDLIMMGIYMANVTVLGLAGLPANCHGLTREDYDENDLVRQPSSGFSTIRSGPGTTENIGELDRFCIFPRSVYGLSVFAIFSYTFSILLTVLYLQQQRLTTVESEKARGQTAMTGHIDEEITPNMHVPDINDASRSPSSSVRALSPPQGSIRSLPSAVFENARRIFSHQSSVSLGSDSDPTWGTTTLISDTESTLGSELHASFSPPPLPPRPSTGGPSTTADLPRRWSMSTISSYNVNAFLVTDGFSPSNDPPAYTSRPGSLYQESMKYEAGLSLDS